MINKSKPSHAGENLEKRVLKVEGPHRGAVVQHGVFTRHLNIIWLGIVCSVILELVCIVANVSLTFTSLENLYYLEAIEIEDKEIIKIE